MTIDKQKSLEAMRTFARDLERERGHKEDSDPKKKTEEPKEAKTKQRKPAKPTPAPEKQERDVSETQKQVPTKEPARHEEPSHIPSFHELQKQTSIRTDIKAEEGPEEKSEKKSKGIQPKKVVGGGTVITSNKTDRTPFFSELKKSITSWVDKLKELLKPKKKNTYTVSKTAHRKGVVQKATSKTGTIFSADNETLREQIKARQRAERKQSETDEDLSWSPYTEPGYPLLEGEELESNDPRVSKIAVTKRTTETDKTNKSKPAPVIKETEKIAELRDEPVAIELPEEPVTPKETPPVPEPKVTPTEVPPTPPEATEDDEQEAEKDEVTPWNLDEISLHDTNTLAMLVVGVVLGISLVGLMLFSVFNNNEAPAPIVSNQQLSNTPLYPGANLKTIQIVSEDFNTVLQQTADALVRNESQLTEWQFIRGNETLLSPVRLINILQTDPGDGFASEVTMFRLIETAADHRGLLLQTSDHTTALGGMLNWEDTLLSDLAPLFDLTELPPNAGTFADTQMAGLDARTLTYENEVILLYAFIGKREVIITTDTAVLEPYTRE